MSKVIPQGSEQVVSGKQSFENLFRALSITLYSFKHMNVAAKPGQNEDNIFLHNDNYLYIWDAF